MNILSKLMEKYHLYRVNKDPSFVARIKHPSEAIQLAVVKKDLGYITFFDSPCQSVQIEAAKQDPFSVTLYDSCEAARKIAIDKDPSINNYFTQPIDEESLDLVNSNKKAEILSKKLLVTTPSLQSVANIFSTPYRETFISAVFEGKYRYELRSPTIKESSAKGLCTIGLNPSSPINYRDFFVKNGLKDEFTCFEKACLEKDRWISSYMWATAEQDFPTIFDLEKSRSKINEKIEESRASLCEMILSKLSLVETSTKSLRCDNGQYQILDRLTGKSHSLDCGDIDMSKLTGNQVKSLLNGNDVPFGSGRKLSLVKGTGGFALSVGKQVVSLADAEAGL